MDSADQRLGIVVVAHRTPRDLLDRAMARVAAAAPEARVVVVETGGGPTVERAASWPATLEAVATANHSYSRAVNVGLERLTTPYLVVMNADVLVERDTFDRLLTAHRGDSRAGVVGPLALTPEGRPQDLGLPYRLNYAAARRSGESGASVSWLSGCLQLFDRDLYQTIGGYDESLRFFNEDLEFCLRARRAGRRCLLVVAPVVHHGGVSTPSHPAFHVEGRRGGYVLSERYLPNVVTFMHRAFLRAEAAIGARLARDENARAGHAMMANLIREGAWHESPFGPTLDDR